MHKARTGIVGHMITVEHRYNEFITAAKPLERVIEYDFAQFVSRNTAQALELKLCLREAFFGELVSEDELLPGRGPKSFSASVTS